MIRGVARVAQLAARDEGVVGGRASVRPGVARLARGADVFAEVLGVVEADRDLLLREDDVARTRVELGRAGGQHVARDPAIVGERRHAVQRSRGRRVLGQREGHDHEDREERREDPQDRETEFLVWLI